MTRAGLPAIFGIVLLVLWEAVIRLNEVPPYIMPAPTAIFTGLRDNAPDLFAGLKVTLEVTFAALALAVATGVLIAVLLASSPVIERTFFPYAIFLQVTPIVTVAPFIIIWVQDIFFVLLILKTS